MGVYINNKIITQIQETKQKELEQAMTLFEIASEKAKVQRLEQENSLILLELAMLKGGI